jgi:hypothetical protein
MPGMTTLVPTVRSGRTYTSEVRENQSIRDLTERDEISATLSTCIRREVVSSNLGRDTG